MVLPRQITSGRFRENLSQADLRFVISTLTSSGAEADALMRLLTDDAARESILDNPRLLQALQSAKVGTLAPSPELFFYILLRPALRQQGIDRADIAAYTAAVLAKPTASLTQQPDSPAHLRKPFDYTNDLMEALSHVKGYDWFCLATAIGDQALLMTGIFGDMLYSRQQRRAAPGPNYYETLGRAHYRSAASHRLAEEFELKETLLSLSELFPRVRQVITQVKANYLSLGAN
jgi:hypothetical protein